MKITISENDEVLKTIELTTLQLKSLRLTGRNPEDYLAGKLERVLDSVVDLAKLTIDRISPLTETELEAMIDEIEVEKKA